jgi:hypothetical protein
MRRPDFSHHNNVMAWLILGYLCSYPDAKDTAEGIGKWWLSAEGVETDVEAVRASLDFLVERRWLMISMAEHSGSRTYGLNQERKTVLQKFLQNQSSFH